MYEVTLTSTSTKGATVVRTWTGPGKNRADAICNAMEHFERQGLVHSMGHIEAKAI